MFDYYNNFIFLNVSTLIFEVKYRFTFYYYQILKKGYKMTKKVTNIYRSIKRCPRMVQIFITINAFTIKILVLLK